jgi:ABC-type phosphonate transport system ATPase subunit
LSFRLIAFHYPRPAHAVELTQRIAKAAEIMAAAPGCQDIDYWKDEGTGAIVATAKFDSKHTCLDALAAAAETVDIAYDDREERPRDVYYLVEADTNNHS